MKTSVTQRSGSVRRGLVNGQRARSWRHGLVALGLGWAAATYAVPASPEPIRVTQPDGTAITLRLRGDEFCHWRTDAAGYPVVQDANGRWVYAQAGADGLTPTAAVVGQADPTTLGLAAAAIQPLTRRQHAMAVAARRAPVAGVHATATEPPPQRAPVAGTTTVRNLVVLACFNDHWSGGTVSASYGKTPAEYTALFNTVGYTADGAEGSVQDYYGEVSYGKLTVNSTVTNWVHLPQNEAFYGANDAYGNDVNPRQMIADALAALDATGFDFSPYDGDGDGWVDCLTVLHSGYGEETGAGANRIWSHKWELASTVTYDGVRMFVYHTSPALRDTSGTGIVRIGVICHEMAHFYGLPDLYDYSGTTEGLGNYCLMAGGSWGGTAGTRPALMSAWCKAALGFVVPQVVHSGSQSLAGCRSTAAVHLVRDGTGSSNEYWLIENRRSAGFDTGMPEGLLIYHVDGNSSNNDLANNAHPLVHLEEQDGNDGLRNSRAVTVADVYRSGAAVFQDWMTSNSQTSNAMLYQPAGSYARTNSLTYYTRIQASGFSVAGDPMTYTLKTVVPTVQNQSVGTGGFNVLWSDCTNETKYEIQEVAVATGTSFSDGAESLDDMYDNWAVSGVQRTTLGKRNGAASYLFAYYDSAVGAWRDSVQFMQLRQPFTLLANTGLSFYYYSHVGTGDARLLVQVSNDNGTTWKTLGTYTGTTAAWTAVSFSQTSSHFTAAGCTVGDSLIARLLVDYEHLVSGTSSFPAYAYAIDDFSVTNTQCPDYTGWVTLSNVVPAESTSYTISSKGPGAYAYRLRSFSNGVWQRWSLPGTVTVTGTPPVLAAIEGAALAYTENAPATAITATVTASDADSTNLASATVQITANYQNGQDLLSFTNTASITGAWTAATGTLTLSGSDTVANYQAALRAVNYQNTSDNPSAATRTVSFTVSDGWASSNTVTRDLAVTAVNDPPVVDSPAWASPNPVSWPAGTTVHVAASDPDGDPLTYAWSQVSGTGTVTFATPDAAASGVTFSAAGTYVLRVTVTDGQGGSTTSDVTVIVNESPVLAAIEGTTLAYTENDPATAITATLTISDADSANLTSGTVAITANYQSGQDVLAFTNQNGITGAWNAVTGTLTLSGSASVANYQAALRAVTYQNTSEDPNTATRTVSFTVNDGVADSNVATRALSVTAVNDAPVLAAIETTAAKCTGGGKAVLLTATTTVADDDTATLAGATIQVTVNYQNGQDVLALPAPVGPITGVWTAATGTLALSGAGTPTEYQAALRTVTFQNTAPKPITLVRTVSITVTDGTATSNALTRAVNVAKKKKAALAPSGGGGGGCALSDRTAAGWWLALVAALAGLARWRGRRPEFVGQRRG